MLRQLRRLLLLLLLLLLLRLLRLRLLLLLLLLPLPARTHLQPPHLLSSHVLLLPHSRQASLPQT